MKKYCLFTFVALFGCSLVMIGQQDLTDPAVVVTDGKPFKRLIRVANPENDKTELFDITGIAGTEFSTSNMADGTSNSYKHAQKITVSLLSSGNKNNSFRVIFYSSTLDMPFAAEVSNNVYSIYFPVTMYSEIREKLDQAFAARKKVQVKVMQGKDGYREGILVL